MNREIKFRSWNKAVRKFTYFGVKEPSIEYTEDNKLGMFLKATSNVYLTPYEDPEQYTGIKDKNGIEIFEGDIVKCTELTNEELIEYVSDVFWDDDAYLVHESKYNDNYLGMFKERKDKYPLTEIEVIGNIYESPNLLNFQQKP